MAQGSAKEQPRPTPQPSTVTRRGEAVWQRGCAVDLASLVTVHSHIWNNDTGAWRERITTSGESGELGPARQVGVGFWVGVEDRIC
ncbi:hypothetical protein EYF80_015303 [Liparis tanakae]|uniref:Uncharacterized protein n=1 Tax=Liparis tanakae TaxID=230148 RepID=A0A4Z2IBP6_9TELE|nr:hypothetical protein EYF80_015303 [Liparis tanakae]